MTGCSAIGDREARDEDTRATAVSFYIVTVLVVSSESLTIAQEALH